MPWERNDNKGKRPDRPRERCLEVFADSRGLSGRINGWASYPRASACASALCWVLPARWAGRVDSVQSHRADLGISEILERRK